MSSNIITAADMDAEVLATYPLDAFLSRDYLEAEKKLLWPKLWQMVERLEDFPEVGDWITYNVAEESVIVLRVAEGEGAEAFKAFHNVCPHRGRQLVSVPDGVHSVRGSKRKNFICAFHGWTYDLEGKNTYILDPQDWDNKLTPEMTCLSKVKLGVWGGYIYLNMDPDCESLASFMGRAGEILDHFELSKMRYKWRQWVSIRATGKPRSRRSLSRTTLPEPTRSCLPMAIIMRFQSSMAGIRFRATTRVKPSSR